jgi:hypothetical protein
MAKLLAEIAGQPSAYHVVSDDLPGLIRQAHVIVISDELIEAVVDLGHAEPRVINALRLGFHLPWPVIWMEYSHGAFVEALAAKSGEPPAEVDRMSGMLLWQRHDGLIELACVAGPEPGKSTRPLEWPIRFIFSPDERLAEPLKDSGEFDYRSGFHRVGSIEYSRAVWGYRTDSPVELGDLHQRAYVALPQPYGRLAMGDPKPFQTAIIELSGVVRMALAAIALVNGPTLRVPEKPASPRVLVRGKSVPAREREVVTLHLPKRVKDRTAYILRTVREGCKRRLHQVRGHYRYLAREPKAAGWQRVEIAGETYWRKWIAAHERGNAELGTVREAKATILTVG